MYLVHLAIWTLVMFFIANFTIGTIIAIPILALCTCYPSFLFGFLIGLFTGMR